jgi:hypothetical protein
MPTATQEQSKGDPTREAKGDCVEIRVAGSKVDIHRLVKKHLDSASAHQARAKQIFSRPHLFGIRTSV